MPPLYQSLELTSGHICLLDIQPSKNISTQLSCMLTCTTLDRNLPYEALSYAWGQPKPKRSIVLNDEEVETFESLAAA
jgi:hypothetical protein